MELSSLEIGKFIVAGEYLPNYLIFDRKGEIIRKIKPLFPDPVQINFGSIHFEDRERRTILNVFENKLAFDTEGLSIYKDIPELTTLISSLFKTVCEKTEIEIFIKLGIRFIGRYTAGMTAVDYPNILDNLVGSLHSYFSNKSVLLIGSEIQIKNILRWNDYRILSSIAPIDPKRDIFSIDIDFQKENCPIKLTQNIVNDAFRFMNDNILELIH